jgi:formate C-acetyltransferase
MLTKTAQLKTSIDFDLKVSGTSALVKALLFLMAKNFNWRPGLNRYLKSDQGWINFTVGICTENESVNTAIQFKDGKAIVLNKKPENCDTALIFKSDKALRKLLGATPTEQIFMVMKSELKTQGNINYLHLFFFFMSLLLINKQKKMMAKEKHDAKVTAEKVAEGGKGKISDEMIVKMAQRLKAGQTDPGVKHLPDPYLSDYSLNDFPRVKAFLDIHFEVKPAICPERPKLVTDWCKRNGFETNSNGEPWIPELRQGHIFNHLLKNKQPIIRENDLIAGTTTTKEIGVVVYPDSHGMMIWSELLTVPHRPLNAYDVSEETLNILHHEVFPYWSKRTFREWVRDHYDAPMSQAIDERFAVYFLWKTVAISHTIPDFPKILQQGTSGMISEINQQLEQPDLNENQRATLEGMILCLDGLKAYTQNLSKQASKDAFAESNPKRRSELKRLAQICEHIAVHPARTLDEAVNAIWISWVGLHMENTNAGLSMGRLDQWLQPYFEADMAKLNTEAERKAYIEYAIELIACLYMRATDHLPLTPDLANWYFGGSSSDQAITLGGITPEGKDAVNDMTYIFLKVTEILTIRDPNVNARFKEGVNTDTYLKRLCEVNLITAGTPSIHSDDAVMESLAQYDYELNDIRDWAATGCVEPTLCGKHMGHTNFQMMNMVGALEMALNNGYHPTMQWHLGPKTGPMSADNFATFDAFFDAFTQQFGFLISQSIEYNDMLGKAHQAIRPTPLLSSLIDGTIRSGKDVTHGGAKYNSSGAACIGLADVTDSMMAIKTLVFDQKLASLKRFKAAIDTDFKDDPELLSMIQNKVPLFGSGNDESVAMANRITKFTHDYYGKHTNYRGGKYTAGFWSMSNHVIFGTLSGALPSGKRAGKSLTPGLTPKAEASDNMLDNLCDVARLDPKNMSNNIAFNVKVVPSAEDSRDRIIDIMKSYTHSYFKLGGMQMQLNVVSVDTLKDAMIHPENYRNLLVRISGYNAYFVTLNRDMQMELIERSSFGL